MRKTYQLITQASINKELFDLIKEQLDVKKNTILYTYYMKISVSSTTTILINNSSQFTISPSAPLIIRTQTYSFKTMTSGSRVEIVYETGDNPKSCCYEINEFIGNGSLPNKATTIIDALNSVYDNAPPSSGGGTGGFRFPNEKTLLKIDETSLAKWNEITSTKEQVSLINTNVDNQELSIKTIKSNINDIGDAVEKFALEVIQTKIDLTQKVDDIKKISSSNSSILESTNEILIDLKNGLGNTNEDLDDLESLISTKPSRTEFKAVENSVETLQIGYSNLSNEIKNKASKDSLIEVKSTIANIEEENSKILSELDAKADSSSLSVAVTSISELDRKYNYVSTLLDEKLDKTDLSSIQIKVDEISSAQDGIEAELSNKANSSSVGKLDSEINKLIQSNKNLQSLIQRNSDEIDEVLLSISSSQKQISSIESRVTLLEGLGQGGSGDGNINNEMLEGLMKALKGLNSKIDLNKNEIIDSKEISRKIQTELDVLKEMLPGALEKIVVLEDRDNQILLTTSKMQEAISRHSSDIEELKLNQNTISFSLESLGELVSNINTRLLDYITKLSAIEGDVSKNSKSLLEIRNEIATISPLIDSNKYEIDRVSKLVGSNSTDILKTKTSLANTQEEVSISREAILYLQEQNSLLESKIKALEEQLTNNGGSDAEDSFYIETNLSNYDRVTLVPGKFLNIVKFNTSLPRYGIIIPKINSAAQMGLSIEIPDSMSNGLRVYYDSGGSSIYWSSGKIELLQPNRVYEFIFTYQSNKFTGGYVEYAKK